MSVLQDLSEEECYLFALFQDYSGIDIVEFCLVDEEFEGGLFRAFPFQYCFAGETEVITKHGYSRIEDLAKLGSAELLSFNDGRSCWVESEVKSFGVQRIVELHLSRRDSRQVIRTTAEHGWFVSHSGGYGLVETKDLSPGMLLQTLDYEDWKVDAVLATDDFEEVFCAVVPEFHCFALADRILTSNCWWRSSDKHQIDQGCLKSDTQILTLNGAVDICDVEVGDVVYTHRHRWRTVTNKFDQGFKQTYGVTVSVGGVSRFIVATANHQFWVRVDGVEQWLALGDWWRVPGVEVALHSVDCADHVWGLPSNVCAVGVEHVWDLEVFEDHSFVANGIVVHNSRSVGKALDVDTPILTASGWKTMSSIEVGDVVFNERAEHVTVTDVFDVQFDRPCFEVCFESGASVVADEDHGWVTWSPSEVFSVRHSRSSPGPGSYRTTADIFRSLSDGHFVPRVRSISGFLHAWVNDFDQVVSVERVVSRPVRCISVSGESRLFLAGRGLVPTHNSMSIRYRAVAFPFVHPGAEMLITAPFDVHLKAITSKIETIYRNNKITRDMILHRGNTPVIRQRPWEIVFESGGRLMGRIPGHDGVGVKGCVNSNALILTYKGLIPVQDIQEGDLVWTHENRWQPVKHVQSFYSDDCWVVDGQGSFENIYTRNHRIYVREDVSSMPGKKKRELGPIARRQVDCFKEDKYVPLNAYWVSPMLPSDDSIEIPEIEGLEFSEDLFWLIGRFLADGYTTTQKLSSGDRGRGRINFAVHPKDQSRMFEVFDRLNFHYSVKSRDHSSADIVIFCHTAMVKWLDEQFGKLADGKYLPGWALFMNEGFKKALLKGYLEGDGSFKKDRGVDVASSASKSLIVGMGHIATSLGRSISTGVSEIKVEEIRGVKLKNKSKDSWRISIHRNNEKVQTNPFDMPGYASYKIKKSEPIEGSHLVYNIVTEDHSYIADGIIHSNTHPTALEADEFCFPAGTMILTSKGHKPIEEVEIGYMVMTHKGRWSAVKNTFNHGVKDTVRVFVQGRDDGVRVTPNHHFWASVDGVVGWVPASELVGCKVLSPTVIPPIGETSGEVEEFLVYRVVADDPVEVYDLEVEDDHSYVADGIIVHNSDYPEAGITELHSTIAKVEGSIYRAHGVTRGVGGSFDKYCQPGSGWTVHRLPAMLRPTWSDEERAETIMKYGSEENIDFRRNVLGLPGDNASSLLVLSRLLAQVDQDELSDYNKGIYFSKSLDDAVIGDAGDPITLLDIPASHNKWDRFWIGMDLGWCVDIETQILTRRGWLNYDQLLIGDESLSINPDTGIAEWNPITDIYKSTGVYDMVHMKGQTFDAMTTPHHKWLVKDHANNWRWRTTDTLTTKDRIPYAVPVEGNKQSPYSDDFVKLVAWVFCEGTVRDKGVEISQSHIVNPSNTSEIEGVLLNLLGESGHRNGNYWTSKIRFDEGNEHPSHHGSAMTYFNINKSGCDLLKIKDIFVGKEKGIDTSFLMSLTKEQLDIFLDVCNKGDGWINNGGTFCFEQHSGVRSDSYQLACALAGRACSTSISDNRGGRWNTSLLKYSMVSPKSAEMQMKVQGSPLSNGMRITSDRKLRTIWCPTIKHHNWLARRNGSVYYTGNTVSPSAICVFAEEKGKKNEPGSTLRLITRILLNRVSGPDQMKIVLHLMDLYRPVAFALDSTGAGQPLVQFLQEEVRKNPELGFALDKIKGYTFSANIVVGLDDTIEIDEYDPNSLKKAEIVRNVKDYSSDMLRKLVDEKRLFLPMDKDLIQEFQGETWTYGKPSFDHYGRRKIYSGIGSHSLDATRLAILAYEQHGIETFLELQEDNWQPPPTFFL